MASTNDGRLNRSPLTGHVIAITRPHQPMQFGAKYEQKWQMEVSNYSNQAA